MLDVGCGPGALTTVLADRVGVAAVSACDPSPPFLDECRTRVPGVDARPGRAEQLPYGDDEFDAAWDPPPTGPLQAGQQVLRALGALDDGGVTDRGRRLSELGLHPRLARALLDGAALVGARAAAEVVALIDDDTLAEGVAADDELRRLRSEQPAEPGAGGSRSPGCSACCPACPAHPRDRVPGQPPWSSRWPIRSGWRVAAPQAPARSGCTATRT